MAPLALASPSKHSEPFPTSNNRDRTIHAQVDMSRLAQLRAWCVYRWESTQVELHGKYSVAHLREFERYQARTGWLHVTLVCLLTPVPVIVYVLLIDALPLEPPERGPLHSPRLWGRTWFTSFQNACCALAQLYQHIPLLDTPRSTSIMVALLASTCALAFIFVASLYVGYPVPFTMILGTIPWAIVMFGLSFYFRRQQFHDHPGLTSSVGLYIAATMCQISLILVYPIYNYFYKSLSSWNQTAFVLLLPLIKLTMKNWICRALPDSDDVKPEAVVFNVEIFHALFVSLCMGNTSSSLTIAALMAVDLAQAWLSFYDMMSIVHVLDPIFTKMEMTEGGAPPHHRMKSLITISDEVLQLAPSPEGSLHHQPHRNRWRQRILRLIRSIHSLVFAGQVTPVQIASFASVEPFVGPPVPAEKRVEPTDITALSTEERERLIEQTQKLLFATEFMVLIEYVEVLMPAMYSVYLPAIFCLPNRAFYPFLEGIDHFSDLKPMISNILLYASCEFVSFIAMAVIVWWKLKFSLAHQLAFVLERRATNIQAKLLLWVVWIMQNSIVQLGADYSLRFAWLHPRDPHHQ